MMPLKQLHLTLLAQQPIGISLWQCLQVLPETAQPSCQQSTQLRSKYLVRRRSPYLQLWQIDICSADFERQRMPSLQDGYHLQPVTLITQTKSTGNLADLGLSTNLFQFIFVAGGEGYLGGSHIGLRHVRSVYNRRQIYFSLVVTTDKSFLEYGWWNERSFPRRMMTTWLRNKPTDQR